MKVMLCGNVIFLFQSLSDNKYNGNKLEGDWFNEQAINNPIASLARRKRWRQGKWRNLFGTFTANSGTC